MLIIRSRSPKMYKKTLFVIHFKLLWFIKKVNIVANLITVLLWRMSWQTGVTMLLGGSGSLCNDERMCAWKTGRQMNKWSHVKGFTQEIALSYYCCLVVSSWIHVCNSSCYRGTIHTSTTGPSIMKIRWNLLIFLQRHLTASSSQVSL